MTELLDKETKEWMEACKKIMSINVSPDMVFSYAVQCGKLPLSNYIEWIQTNRDWESIKKLLEEDWNESRTN